MVGPQPVDGPVVGGTRCRRSVPELGLQELAAGRVETAGVLNSRGVLAGGLGVAAGGRATT